MRIELGNAVWKEMKKCEMSVKSESHEYAAY